MRRTHDNDPFGARCREPPEKLIEAGQSGADSNIGLSGGVVALAVGIRPPSENWPFFCGHNVVFSRPRAATVFPSSCVSDLPSP
jgi:hypothetical protein